MIAHGIRLQLTGRVVYKTQACWWSASADSYRRFDTAAEAIRFAVEEFPALRTLRAWMQVGDERFDSDEICRLYESSEYPLLRDVSRTTDRE